MASQPISTKRNPAAWTALLLALGLLAAACGTETQTDERSVAALTAPETDEPAGDSDSDNDGARDSDNNGDGEGPTQEEIERAELQFEQCLEDNGVSLGGGVFGDSDGESVAGVEEFGDGDGATQSFEIGEGDFEEFEAAMAECDKLLEDVYGTFTPSPEQEAAMADAQAAFDACMAENGIDIESEGSDGAISLQIDSDEDFEEMEAVMDECSKEAFGDFDQEFFGSEDDGS